MLQRARARGRSRILEDSAPRRNRGTRSTRKIIPKRVEFLSVGAKRNLHPIKYSKYSVLQTHLHLSRTLETRAFTSFSFSFLFANSTKWPKDRGRNGAVSIDFTSRWLETSPIEQRAPQFSKLSRVNREDLRSLSITITKWSFLVHEPRENSMTVDFCLNACSVGDTFCYLKRWRVKIK